MPFEKFSLKFAFSVSTLVFFLLAKILTDEK